MAQPVCRHARSGTWRRSDGLVAGLRADGHALPSGFAVDDTDELRDLSRWTYRRVGKDLILKPSGMGYLTGICR